MQETEAERVERLNLFAREKHPGLVGIEISACNEEEVRGSFMVRAEVIAGTGFLWAPVVVTLADWLCAAGTPLHFPKERDASFTTVELKTNFLGSAREGEVVSARAVPAHVGRSTQVWDVSVRNDTQDKIIALFRCTQMVLYRT